MTCEKVSELDPCRREPCKNGGVCTKSGTNYICDCKLGYVGVTCEKEIPDLKEVEFAAQTFIETITSVSSSPNIPLPAKECENKYVDSKNKTRMIGRSCPSTRRKRQSGIETENAGPAMKRDILFLIDESVSVGVEHFGSFKRLTRAIVSNFCGDNDVDNEKTKIAVMTFDRRQHMHIDFRESYKKANLLDGIQNIPYNESTSEFTCLVESLQYAKDEIFDIDHGARPLDDNIRREVFLISDGCAYCLSNSNVADQLTDIARNLREQHVSITTLLVGSHTNECVKQMSSLLDGSKCYQLFTLGTWDEVDVYIQTIERLRCEATQKLVGSCDVE